MLEGEERKDTVAFLCCFLPEILCQDIQIDSPVANGKCAPHFYTKLIKNKTYHHEVWELTTENQSDDVSPGARRTFFQWEKDLCFTLTSAWLFRGSAKY